MATDKRDYYEVLGVERIVTGEEINRAYRDLRAARNLKDPLELNEDWSDPVSRGRGWPLRQAPAEAPKRQKFPRTTKVRCQSLLGSAFLRFWEL